MKKATLLLFVVSFCTVLIFAQNKLPHSIDYRSQNNFLYEKSISSASDYELIFEESNVSGGRFGWTVSTVGDFNGDGIDDVAVGADKYNSSTGYIGLFFGGDNIETDIIYATGENPGDFFGGNVSCVGDYNNDGFDDFLVNANGFNEATGRCYLFLGGAVPDLEPDLVFDGTFTTEWFGYRHAGNGDINNDGYSDIIISSQNFNNDKGAAFVYFGSENPDNIFDFTYNGEYYNNSFSNTLSIDGDVNNDGYDDILITARGYSTNKGKAYLYFGGETLNEISDQTFERTYDTDYYAYTSSYAGDINNDGFEDFMIGAYGSFGSYGRCYLYFGGETPDNTADLEFYKDTGGNTDFANSLSQAGDFNNDGYDDFVIGDPIYNFNYDGAAYIYFGGENPDNVEDLVIEGEDDESLTISVSYAGDVNNDGISDIILGATGSRTAKIYHGSETPDTEVDAVLEGAGTDNNFGFTSSSAGDFNNDGYQDLIVGAYGYDQRRGRSYIYFGGEDADNIADITFGGEDYEDGFFGWSVAGIGDVNNDGFDDVAVGAIFYATNLPGKVYVYFGGSEPDSLVDVVIDQNVANDWLGYFINPAGDVNNDGIDDFTVGAVGTQNTTGKAYLYLGKENFTGQADLIFNDGTSGSWFGASVGSLDFNNDGFEDIVVGAPGHNNLIGKFDLYYGSATPDNIPDFTVQGYEIESVFGHSVAGLNDFNGDGYDDIIAGAPDYGNQFKGQAYIYFGGENPDIIPAITFDGEIEDGGFARFVKSVGDINNDGYDDAGIGAYNAGITYIYYGAENPDNTADETYSENGGGYGWSFTTIDFFGDNSPDLFISAYAEPPNGKTYMYYTDPIPVLIDEINEAQITVYPNPSSGEINIHTNDNMINPEIMISDINGKTIIKTNNCKIDLSGMKPGVYFILIKDKKSIFRQKLIVK